MKKYLFLVLLLFHYSFSFAQMKGQKSGQAQAQSSMPKFNAKNFAGILRYDTEKIYKKLKIKDSGLQNKINKFISVYNKKIDEILFLNTPKLEKIEREVNLQREIAMANKDREAMMLAMEQARKELAPVKEEVIIANKSLNLEMSKILTEKQYKKWLKFQKNKKESLNPKNRVNPNNNSGGQRRGGMSGGGGGHGKRMGY